MSNRKKTVYCLRVGESDDSKWSEPTFYRTRKDRDHNAQQLRAIAGLRVWSYDERMAKEKADEIFAALAA